MKIEISLGEATRHRDGSATLAVEVPELELRRELDLSFGELHDRCGIPDGTTLDLLLVASVCYVIDKTVKRARSFDGWTRELEAQLPVSALRKWQSVATRLNRALQFLTGDEWNLSFREAEVDFFRAPEPKRRRKQKPPAPDNIDRVCLFSGGLDSLTGAIDLLEEKEAGGLRLVGHYDAAGAASTQERLLKTLDVRYPRRCDLLQMRVSHRPLNAEESTLRSRSLVFMALGVYAARAAGEHVPLYAPENGLIAVNVPLNASRSGSCSTRTMHPYFLDSLRGVLKGLSIENPIINPSEFKTKGECLAECANRKLLSVLMSETVSCSHPTRKQFWRRRNKEVRNCGYCVPCLIRRAAMHRVGLDAAGQYGLDVCGGEVDVNHNMNDSADDFRAMLDMLRSRKTADDFVQDILAVAPVDRIRERAEMIERGFGEIRALIEAKGNGAVRRAAAVFEVHSQLGIGTALLCELWAKPPAPVRGHFRFGAASVALAGQMECGDTWAEQDGADQVRLIVADGLGHGGDAAIASRKTAAG